MRMMIDSSAVHVADYLGHLYDTNTRIGFPSNDVIRFEAGGTTAINIYSSDVRLHNLLRPNADSTLDIGTNTVRFANIYADSLYGGGNGLYIDDSIIHNGDTDTKIRFPSNDQISFETGGSERLRINSTGQVLIGSASSRNVGGSTTNSRLQIEGTSTNTSSLSLVNNEASTAAPFVFFGKTRGNSVGESGQIQSGDTLGGLSFIGADGTDTNNRSAEITAVVNGSPANNTIPTNLVFSTSAQNASQLAERFRIYYTNTGNGGIAKFTSPASGDMLNLQNNTASGQGLILGVDTNNDYTYLRNNTSSTYSMVFNVNGSERIRYGPLGQIGIAGANYGTAGQVLKSGGASAAASWGAAGGNTETYARVVFGAVYDTNSGYIVHNITSGSSNGITIDTTNEKLTPTVSGTYLIIYNAHWLGLHSSGATYYNRITKNGSEIISSNFSAYNSGSHMHTVMTTISMNGSSDYIQFEFYENKSGAAAYVNHKSRAVVILLDT